MYLGDGKMIQSTKEGTPFKFTLDKQPLIPGVKEAIMKMRVGGKARLFIPYYLGYGEAGGGPFPKKADLIFELELLKVGK
jgi:FKBP-type peptidyl-prolyl cis-trans isomerase